MKLLASLSDLPNGTFVSRTVDGLSLLVGNADGTYFAIEDKCPHADVTFGHASLAGCKLTCPWHGFRFDVLTGDCEDLPSLDPLNRLPVVAKDDQLYLDLDEMDVPAPVTVRNLLERPQW